MPFNRNINREAHQSCPSVAVTMPELDNGTARSDWVRLFGLVKDVGEVALAAVLTVVHSSHEDTSTALSRMLTQSS